jgi:hypothetical protein
MDDKTHGNIINPKKNGMKLLKPFEISAKILTLMAESDESVILVSPYMKISKWYKLLHRIDALKKRNVEINVFIRDDPENAGTYRELDRLALRYTRIPNLHCKLYLNEYYGIVTSLNLLLSSEIHSLEIGYVTESKGEYDELQHFCQRYILQGDSVHCGSVDYPSTKRVNETVHQIREGLDKEGINSWLWLKGDVLNISTVRNRYCISITNGFLHINSNLPTNAPSDRRSLMPLSKTAKKIGELTGMKIDVHSRPEDSVWCISLRAYHPVKSSTISQILDADYSYVLDSLLRIIISAESITLKRQW